MAHSKNSQKQGTDAQSKDAQEEDVREAWVLRAGAELWKVVVAEAEHPAADTQIALAAVRLALDCARRLRCAGDISEAARNDLETECDNAAEAQMLALQQWGRGRGMQWGTEWGMQWGETLSSEDVHFAPLQAPF